MELGRASWRLCALAFPSRSPDLKAACLRAPALTLLITLLFSPVNYTNTAGLTGENAHLALGEGGAGGGGVRWRSWEREGLDPAEGHILRDAGWQ